MSFAYRDGKSFYIGFKDESGKPRREKCSATTLTAARRLAAEEEAFRERVRLGHTSARMLPHTGDELCDRYEADVMPNHKNKGSTKSQMRLYVRPFLAGRLLGDITPGDIEAWVTGLRKGGLVNSTRALLLMRLQSVLGYAVDKLKWLTANPAKEASRPKVATHAPKALTPEEVVRLLSVSEKPFRNILAVAVYCGLRKGELARLPRSAVDMSRGTITVGASFNGSTKSGKERTVGIPGELVPFLLSALSDSRGGELLFPNARGLPRKAHWRADREFKAALRKAGINRALAFRNTRSTYGTHMYQTTGDIRGTSLLLGHSKVQTTTTHYADAPLSYILGLAGQLAYGTQPGRSEKQALALPAGETAENLNESSCIPGTGGTMEGKPSTWGSSDGTGDTGAVLRPYRAPAVRTVSWLRAVPPKAPGSRHEGNAATQPGRSDPGVES